ncbi:MAG TPA: FHA domain-containing protein [Polyangiaceae bacterium]|nr:FHA domain-containing protein [Polyangiaceae bacterium]
MSPDPNKKSERAFQCRDILWETFEQMARELECSVDYLINEAMKQYARQRTRVGRTDSVPASGGLGPSPAATGRVPAAAASGSVGGLHTPSPGLALGPRAGLAPPLPVAGGYLPPPPLPPPPVIAPRLGATLGGTLGGRPPLPAPPTLGSRPPLMGAPPPLPAPHPLASPMPAPAHQPQPAPSGRVLVAYYMGEQVPITKDRFVIGRGRQSSDLTIKDPNVSRQHAMVEFQNGQYYMVDLGSTNGVEYNGQRISKQLIVDGDTFRICDHEVRFVFA